MLYVTLVITLYVREVYCSESGVSSRSPCKMYIYMRLNKQ